MATPHELQRVAVPLRLPRWLVEWMESSRAGGMSKAGLIEYALMQEFKLQQPRIVVSQGRRTNTKGK